MCPTGRRRRYAQKDPLIEYKLEGYNLFREMMAQIRRNVIYSVYQFKPKPVAEPAAAEPAAATNSKKKAKAKSNA